MTDDKILETTRTDRHLGWLLDEKGDALVERWAQRILDDPSVPSANRLSRPALEDHIPTLIAQLLERLASHAPRDWGEHAGHKLGSTDGLGRAHAQQRSASHFTIAEALRELSHFREAVLDLCTENEVVLRVEEAKLLHAAIDELIVSSAMAREGITRHDTAQVMAMVAHDLRAPLGVVAMLSTLLKDGAPMNGNTHGAMLDRSIAQMTRLIDDLLTTTTLEAGFMALDGKRIDLRAVVQGAIAHLDYAASRRRIRLTYTPPPNEVMVTCDVARIERVLANLLGNALKFTPAGGEVAVQVHASPTDAIVRVRDTGPGIREEDREAIFQPFWQGNGAARSGVGLGLAIARGMILAHGGTIAVETPEGGGSIFCFKLPLDSGA